MHLAIMRKSPVITISPSDYDHQSLNRPWWKRALARRTRSLVLLTVLLTTVYYVKNSFSSVDNTHVQSTRFSHGHGQHELPDSLFVPEERIDSVVDTQPKLPQELQPHPPQVADMPENSPSDPAAAIASLLPQPIEINNAAEEEFPNATIGMMTMMYGDPNPAYERALQTHYDHAKRHGYRTHVLRQKLLGRLWSKPAFVLSVILNELQKPSEKRLKWLFWFDADTVIVNQKVPLETFLPPEPQFSHIHFLCGDDHNGLNDGAFLLRVNDYSLHLMAAALTVESFRPEIDLRFSEQSAIEHVVQSEDLVRPWENYSYTDGFAKIPQRWMNAYMGPRSETGAIRGARKIEGNTIKEGDLLLHFVGSGETKRRRITVFMDAFEQQRSQWEKEITETTYQAEIAAFWEHWKLVEEKRRKQIEQEVARLEKEELEKKPEPKEELVVPTPKTAAPAKPRKPAKPPVVKEEAKEPLPVPSLPPPSLTESTTESTTEEEKTEQEHQEEDPNSDASSLSPAEAHQATNMLNNFNLNPADPAGPSEMSSHQKRVVRREREMRAGKIRLARLAKKLR